MITYFNPPDNNFTAKDIQEYYDLAEYRYEQAELLYSMIKNNIRDAVNKGYRDVHYIVDNTLTKSLDDIDTEQEIIDRLEDDGFRVEKYNEHVIIHWD